VPTFCFYRGLFTPSGHQLERVREVAERVARSYGLEVFDVQLRREAVGLVLRVIIDRPDPGKPLPADQDAVGIEDCQRVSQDLSAILDVEEEELGADALGQAYTLEVSSPGLDRPLRRPDDYRRFAGRLAKIVMRERIDGQGFFRGRLGGVDGGDVLIDGDDGKTHRVPIAVITRANLEVEF